MAIWRTRFACWVSKATRVQAPTNTEIIILIAFPQQQWLHQRTSILRYTYIVGLVKIILDFAIFTVY
jgi:hypothetical protein